MEDFRRRADELVDHMDDMKQLESGGELEFNLGLIYDSGIIVHKGIEKLAEAVGEPLILEETGDECFKYRLHFDYRGYRFISYLFDKGDLKW